MRTFKEYLTEGGNITVGSKKAQPIKVEKGSRSAVALDIKTSLHALHKSFFKEHGLHLFGKDAKALAKGSAYSGGTSSLMSTGISDDDYAKHKPETSDVDVQVPAEHMAHLHTHLKPGAKFGRYRVVGVKKIGGEHHALMQHSNGQIHQFDFEGVKYSRNEPSAFDRFSHSADWADTQKGIKGMHHKVLMNAIGGEKHKFSARYGIGNRAGEPEWDNDIKSMSKKYFGDKADHRQMGSFQGLASLIKQHVPAEHHKAIFDKFSKDVTTQQKDPEVNKAAIKHLKRALNIK